MAFKRARYVTLATALSLVLVGCGGDDAEPQGAAETGDAATDGEPEGDDAAAEGGDGEYVVGVSNTLVGNGWREQMICAVKAQSLASGMVSEVIEANRNGGATEQIADLQNLISQGVDAIIVNPSDREALDPVIDAAAEQGIVVVSVDQAVTSENAYVATNDQVAVGRIGAEWLFEEMGGSGDVLYMRGIDGVPADSDRHEGFQEALESYPDIDVVSEVFTGWDYSEGGQQALEVFGTQEVDGVWTSGTDYTVVNAMETAGHPLVPLVGQDTNQFVNQIVEMHPEFVGAVTTNPAAIGGVGTAIALDVLEGGDVERATMLEPEVLSYDEDQELLEELYLPDRDATFPVQAQVEPFTTYSDDELFACEGPGES
jgi:ribose transport system substrate-binding protein